MIELPSVKLNIFKKLEYFLILKELNKQFDEQFELAKNNGKLLPTWEIEKKILFWTYAYHKYLGSTLQIDDFKKIPIKSNKLKDIFISEYEVERGDQSNIGKLLKNLDQRGFSKEIQVGQALITKEGLAFGELLWNIYIPKKGNHNGYTEKYKTKYKLGKTWRYWNLECQLLAVYLLITEVIIFFGFEIISKVGLMDDLKNIFVSLPHNIAIITIFIPIFLFIVPFGLDKMGPFGKYKKVEELKEELQ